MLAHTIHNTAQVDNFTFLKDGLAELYVQANFAECYYITDPQSSLAKMRLFVEVACHELGRHLGLKPPVHGDLANKIKMLEASGSVDDWVIETMNLIRLEGNRSVHMTEVNGNYVAKLSISHSKMHTFMSHLYEIASYVAQTVLQLDSREFDKWREPTSCEFSSHVSHALKGSRDSSYHLAHRYYQELQDMAKLKGASRWWNKSDFLDKQKDLLYWLEKSNHQGHDGTWLLFAKSYQEKFLAEEGKRNAKASYKQALKKDDTGEAALEFGCYLQDREEFKLGQSYIEKSAKLGFHPALEKMLMLSYDLNGQNDCYKNWLALAISFKLPSSFSADAFLKLIRYENEANDLTLKSLRTALIISEARQAPGTKFIKAYVEQHVFEKLEAVQATKNMIEDHENLPCYLAYEHKLFNQIKHSSKHFKLMKTLYQPALKLVEGDNLATGAIKYAIAKIALEVIQVEKQVETPSPITVLLKQAADLGDSDARVYINSQEGKSVMKRAGISSVGHMKKCSALKVKQKRMKKIAKKSKRK